MKKTALITGASSGIGLELAHEFAKNGHDLVLVARSKQKLAELANTIESKYAVKAQVLSKDLSNPDSAAEVFDWCQSNNIHVDYLVNNAGIGDYGPFIERDWNKLRQMIDLNITSLTYLTHLFLPAMVAKKYGRIMQVASTASFQPGPSMSVYFATKAYVLHFSEAIGNELKGSGVTVTALCPGATESGFQYVAEMEESRLVKDRKLPTSADVARYGYRAMMKGKSVAIHGLMNYLLANSVRMIPRGMVVNVSSIIQGKK